MACIRIEAALRERPEMPEALVVCNLRIFLMRPEPSLSVQDRQDGWHQVSEWSRARTLLDAVWPQQLLWRPRSPSWPW